MTWNQDARIDAFHIAAEAVLNQADLGLIRSFAEEIINGPLCVADSKGPAETARSEIGQNLHVIAQIEDASQAGEELGYSKGYDEGYADGRSAGEAGDMLTVVYRNGEPRVVELIKRDYRKGAEDGFRACREYMLRKIAVFQNDPFKDSFILRSLDHDRNRDALLNRSRVVYSFISSFVFRYDELQREGFLSAIPPVETNSAVVSEDKSVSVRECTIGETLDADFLASSRGDTVHRQSHDLAFGDCH